MRYRMKPYSLLVRHLLTRLRVRLQEPPALPLISGYIYAEFPERSVHRMFQPCRNPLGHTINRTVKLYACFRCFRDAALGKYFSPRTSLSSAGNIRQRSSSGGDAGNTRSDPPFAASAFQQKDPQVKRSSSRFSQVNSSLHDVVVFGKISPPEAD